jgi:hypothetical protein
VRALVKASLVIQAASALTLIVQSLLMPRILGASGYGQAVTLMAVPLLLQGIVEPMMTGAAIDAHRRAESQTILRRARVHLGIAIVPAAALTLGFAVLKQAQWGDLLLLAIYVPLVIVNTGLRAMAVAMQRHATMAGHYLAALVATIAALPLAMAFGVSGYLSLMVVVHITVSAFLLSDMHLRKSASDLLWSRRAARSDFEFWRCYVANVMPRAAQLAFGPGMLLIASLQLTPSQLAEFRICQTLLGMMGYLVPMLPALLQAHVADGFRADSPVKDFGLSGRHSRLLLTAAAVPFLASAVTWLTYPWVAGYLLHGEVSGEEFRQLLWIAPVFSMLPNMSALLLGLGRDTLVAVANGVGVFVGVAIGLSWAADVGLVWGTLSTGLTLAAGVWSGERRR